MYVFYLALEKLALEKAISIAGVTCSVVLLLSAVVPFLLVGENGYNYLGPLAQEEKPEKSRDDFAWQPRKQQSCLVDGDSSSSKKEQRKQVGNEKKLFRGKAEEGDSAKTAARRKKQDSVCMYMASHN